MKNSPVCGQNRTAPRAAQQDAPTDHSAGANANHDLAAMQTTHEILRAAPACTAEVPVWPGMLVKAGVDNAGAMSKLGRSLLADFDKGLDPVVNSPCQR